MSLCPPIPAPLEADTTPINDLFRRSCQRTAVRHSLAGLLLSAELNTTLTSLANAEPVVRHSGRGCSGCNGSAPN